MNHLVSMSDEDFAELKVKPFTPGSCVPRPPSSVNHDRCARGWDAAYCVKCGSQLEFPLPEEASNGLAYFRSLRLACSPPLAAQSWRVCTVRASAGYSRLALCSMASHVSGAGFMCRCEAKLSSCAS